MLVASTSSSSPFQTSILTNLLMSNLSQEMAVCASIQISMRTERCVCPYWGLGVVLLGTYSTLCEQSSSQSSPFYTPALYRTSLVMKLQLDQIVTATRQWSDTRTSLLLSCSWHDYLRA